VLTRVDHTVKGLTAARFIDAGGVRTHVGQWGREDDDSGDVLLIHGASSDMGVFEPTIIPLLKDRCRLTAYDRPGMGFTVERPPGAERLEVQARVAAGVIEAMALDRPIVMAHSWGGAVALRLALDRPDLVSGLLLVAPVAYEWPGGVSWHVYWSSNPLIGRVFNHVIAPPFASAVVRSGLKGAFGPGPVPDDYITSASVMRCARPRALHANSRDMIAAKREIIAQQGRYPRITMPVAILTGDSDTVVSPEIHAGRLAQVLLKARLDVLPGVGHLPHEVEPDRLGTLYDWAQRESKGD
jgi:pimeloyl-ACP methyl ester carboxylesterase